MLKLATCSIAALLTVASISPAPAWEANPEPGYCAQFFTNIDCNTIGADPPGKGQVAEPEEPEPAPVVPSKPKKEKKRAAAAPQPAKQPSAGAAPVSR